ncbi:unnamed protein product [Cyclocybe aegerita]|uniref:Uncharacterized protein n=1 Tax=Cyclocybe aegerita TaxID=1973307 RepID=A0A8S0W0E0_CYCAE|nr:unnamed protein product [Cyclocybe aegerita]
MRYIRNNIIASLIRTEHHLTISLATTSRCTGRLVPLRLAPLTFHPALPPTASKFSFTCIRSPYPIASRWTSKLKGADSSNSLPKRLRSLAVPRFGACATRLLAALQFQIYAFRGWLTFRLHLLSQKIQRSKHEVVIEYVYQEEVDPSNMSFVMASFHGIVHIFPFSYLMYCSRVQLIFIGEERVPLHAMLSKDSP